MTATISWLEAKVPGFAALTADERQAITDFSLMWSLFEAQKLGSHGTAASVKNFATEMILKGYDVRSLHDQLAYFRNRYFPGGAESHHFAHLNLRASDCPIIVQQVLNGADSDAENVLLTLLMIVYRFRNNLFHGLKWAYGIQGQHENFRHATLVLTEILEA